MAFDHETDSLDVRRKSTVLITDNEIFSVFPASDKHQLLTNIEIVDVHGKGIPPKLRRNPSTWLIDMAGGPGFEAMCGKSDLAKYLFRCAVMSPVEEH